MSATTPYPLPTGPLKAVADRVGRRWWLLLIPGITWIIIGFVVLRFDATAATVISVVFGVMVLLAALGEAFNAAITAGGCPGDLRQHRRPVPGSRRDLSGLLRPPRRPAHQRQLTSPPTLTVLSEGTPWHSPNSFSVSAPRPKG